jgi:hypothetical protein
MEANPPAILLDLFRINAIVRQNQEKLLDQVKILEQSKVDGTKSPGAGTDSNNK